MAATTDITRHAERVGLLDMRVVIAERSDESDDRWRRRVEALAAWLLAEWEHERRGRREAC